MSKALALGQTRRALRDFFYAQLSRAMRTCFREWSVAWARAARQQRVARIVRRRQSLPSLARAWAGWHMLTALTVLIRVASQRDTCDLSGHLTNSGKPPRKSRYTSCKSCKLPPCHAAVGCTWRAQYLCRTELLARTLLAFIARLTTRRCYLIVNAWRMLARARQRMWRLAAKATRCCTAAWTRRTQRAARAWKGAVGCAKARRHTSQHIARRARFRVSFAVFRAWSAVQRLIQS